MPGRARAHRFGSLRGLLHHRERHIARSYGDRLTTRYMGPPVSGGKREPPHLVFQEKNRGITYAARMRENRNTEGVSETPLNF